MAPSRLVQLAESIINNTKTVDSYFDQRNLPRPSFDSDGPLNFGITSDARDVEAARIQIIEASWELADLLQGPMAFLRPIQTGAALQAISKWDIATKIPLGGEVSFIDLAQQCQVHETDMRRVIRYVMTFHRLFSEPRPGYVSHSLASRLLAEEPLLRQGLWLLGEDSFVSSGYIVEAMDKFKDGQEPNQTGFQLAHGTELSSYDYIESRPEFARRFALAQTSFARFPHRPAASAPTMTLEGTYDWPSVGSGLVVDLGGSRGTDAIRLAALNGSMRILVQDLSETIAGAAEALPEDLRDSGRVSFMPYSFFEPQTVSADVYFIKQCLHNWPDHYVVRILKNQVPALKPGARFVIIDSLAPPPGKMSLMDERTVRAFDLLMLAKARGREREESEWLRIFNEADQRFSIVSKRRFNTIGDFSPFTGVIEVAFDV